MNSIFLLLAIGSVDVALPSEKLAAVSLPPASRPASLLTQEFVLAQESVDWPKLDPRDPGAHKQRGPGGGSSAKTNRQSGPIPSIDRSQLQKQVPSYEEQSPQPAGRLVKPTAAQNSDESKDDGVGSRFARQTQPEAKPEVEEKPVSSVRPRIEKSSDEPLETSRESFRQRQFDQDDESEEDRHNGFTSQPIHTSVRRQSGKSRETAPDPYEIRTASVSDDEEDSYRGPIRSFAVGLNEPEDDFGVEPIDGPLISRRNGEERIADSRGNVRNANHSAENDRESTLQGGKKMPEENNGYAWGFAVVILLLLASVGANAYLAWIAREFYERYRSLAQQVRASRNNLT